MNQALETEMILGGGDLHLPDILPASTLGETDHAATLLGEPACDDGRREEQADTRSLEAEEKGEVEPRERLPGPAPAQKPAQRMKKRRKKCKAGIRQRAGKARAAVLRARALRREFDEVLADTRLEMFRTRLLDYGLESVQDVAEEGLLIEKQLFECGLKKGQVIRLVLNCRKRLTAKGKHPPTSPVGPLSGSLPPAKRKPWGSACVATKRKGAESSTTLGSRAGSKRGLRLPPAAIANSPSATVPVTPGSPTCHDHDSTDAASVLTTDSRPRLPAGRGLPDAAPFVGMRHRGGKDASGLAVRGPGAQTAYHALNSSLGLPPRESFSISLDQLSSDGATTMSPLQMMPPGLPSVDAHINQDSLRLANINADMRQYRNKFHKKDQGGDRGRDGSTDKGAGGFTTKEIKRVVKYIDSMNESGQSDGEVDLAELETAFRRARRARAIAEYEDRGRQCIFQLEELMKLQGMKVAEWFAQMDHSGSGLGNGSITPLELKTGLQDMAKAKKFRDMRFSDEDCTDLVRYMDPNGDGDLTVVEVEDAIRRAHLDPKSAAIERQAGEIVKKLEEVMDSNNMRIVDLFRKLDKDRGGSISLEELRLGLNEFAMPSGEERLREKKAKQEQAAAAEAEAKAKAEEQMIKKRMAIARKCGAHAVLKRLEIHMHYTNFRVKDLFSQSGFDTDGDGLLDAQEFHKAVGELGLEMELKDVKTLIRFLDEGGDGQIQASELETALRHLNRDEQTLHVKHGHADPRAPGESNPTARPTRKKKSPASLGGSDYGDDASSVTGVTEASKPVGCKLVVQSGSQLDSNWLSSFDDRMSLHLTRALTK